MIALTDELCHFAVSHLIQQVIPSVFLILDGNGTIQRYTDELRQSQSSFLTESRHLCATLDGILNLHAVNDGGICGDLDSGLIAVCRQNGFRHGAFPIAAGEIDDIVGSVIVKFVEVRMIQLVGDGSTGGSRCISSSVQRSLLILDSQSSIAFADHLGQVNCTICSVFQFSFCSQNIVQSLMRAIAGCKVVVSGINNVGLCAVCIVSTHFTFGNGNIDGNGLTCRNGDFFKTDQFDGSFFNAIFTVIVRIGRLHIDLDSLAPIDGTGIGDVDGKHEIIAGFLHGQAVINKVSIGQTIAKGISHSGGIVVIANIGVAENFVLITRLIIAVSDIDAFLIGDIILVVGSLERKSGLSRVGVRGRASILNSGAGQIIVAVGIHQLAAGVDRAVQQVADGFDTRLPNFTHPHTGIHTVVHAANRRFKEVQFNRIGTIEQNNDLFDLTSVFHLSQLCQKVALFLAQREHIAITIADSVPRNVGALTADTRDDHNGGITVISDGVPFSIRVSRHRNFVDGKVCVIEDVVVQTSGILFAAIVFACTGGVKIPHSRVDRETVIFQCILQCHSSRGVHATRTRTAIDEIHAVLADESHFAALCQWQSILAIQHQDSTVCFYAFADGFRRILLFFTVSEISFKMNFAFIADSLARFYTQNHIDDRGVVVCNRAANHGDSEQNGKNAGTDAPQKFLSVFRSRRFLFHDMRSFSDWLRSTQIAYQRQFGSLKNLAGQGSVFRHQSGVFDFDGDLFTELSKEVLCLLGVGIRVIYQSHSIIPVIGVDNDGTCNGRTANTLLMLFHIDAGRNSQSVSGLSSLALDRSGSAGSGVDNSAQSLQTGVGRAEDVHLIGQLVGVIRVDDQRIDVAGVPCDAVHIAGSAGGEQLGHLAGTAFAGAGTRAGAATGGQSSCTCHSGTSGNERTAIDFLHCIFLLKIVRHVRRFV